LIDILPGINKIKPNIADPSLLPLPATAPGAKKGLPETAPLKVLISFGQEDAAGLGIAASQSLAAKNSGSMDITLLTTANYLPNLSEHLHEYGLIITHYGLTAFEALYAGAPVLLVSPGRYHEQLAKTAGFYSAGIGKGGAARIAALLSHKGAIDYPFLDRLKARCTALARKYRLDHAPEHSMAALIAGFAPDARGNCPVCGTAIHVPALARFAERTYRRCTHCGIISMNRLNPPPIAYEREYFFEFYQQQYGKTYLEDFPHLIAMGKLRLAIIKSLLPACATASPPPLLDIGCAYGPFLASAREEGFSPHGIDPAQDAIRYVTQTLNLPAAQGSFPHDYQLPTANGPLYSVITLWYVIEHFRDCIPVLAEIRTLLKPGGILAFATPSFAGISGRSALARFLEHSPADHWTIWSPAVCPKALKKAGFTVKKIVNSGHHPERFPRWGIFAKNKKSPLYGLLLAVSKMFSLGDTFEVYAVKN
jgi:2-polyprenyl-3-methyl-5-hydroxy-6-metoxy-1,4-benzoquinol methylase